MKRESIFAAMLLLAFMAFIVTVTEATATPTCQGARVKNTAGQTIGNVRLCDLGTVDGISTYSVDVTQVNVAMSGRVGLCVGRNGEPYCGFLSETTAGFTTVTCTSNVLSFTQQWNASIGAPHSVVFASSDLNTYFGVGRLTGDGTAKGC
jgi:hypothetical protein